MAKRRILKKDISYLAGDLFTEVVICMRLIPGVEKEKAEALLTRIIDMNNEYIKRAHFPDGKDNKQRVKQYYNRLVEDLQKEVDEIVGQIGELSNGKLV